MKPSDGYDYEVAGFDNFLNRSIADTTQTNLNASTAQSQQIRFDSMQVSGALGDTFRIGSIFLDGAKGRITIDDDTGNTVVILGELDG